MLKRGLPNQNGKADKCKLATILLTRGEVFPFCSLVVVAVVVMVVVAATTAAMVAAVVAAAAIVVVRGQCWSDVCASSI